MKDYFSEPVQSLFSRAIFRYFERKIFWTTKRSYDYIEEFREFCSQNSGKWSREKDFEQARKSSLHANPHFFKWGNVAFPIM